MTPREFTTGRDIGRDAAAEVVTAGREEGGIRDEMTGLLVPFIRAAAGIALLDGAMRTGGAAANKGSSTSDKSVQNPSDRSPYHDLPGRAKSAACIESSSGSKSSR